MKVRPARALMDTSGATPSALLFLFVLAVYLFTLAPGWGAVNLFNNWDGLEYLLCANLGGVDHPSGHPLYLLMVKTFTCLVPFVTPALAINLFSALFGALAITLLYRVLLLTLTTLNRPAPDLLRPGTAATAALVLAFSVAFWNHAVIPEVHTFYLTTMAVVLLCVMKFLQTGETRWMLMSGLSVGLSLSTSFLNAVTLAVPVLAALWIFRPSTSRAGTLSWFASLGLVVLGFSFYAWYPVVLARGPGIVHPLSEMGPYPVGSLPWYGWYIRGEAWTANHMFSVGRILGNVPIYVGQFIQTLGWAGLLLCLLSAGQTIVGCANYLRRAVPEKGILVALRTAPLNLRWMALVGIVFLGVALPEISIQDPSNPGESTLPYLANFFLPSFFIATIGVAAGLATVVDRVARRAFWPSLGLWLGGDTEPAPQAHRACTLLLVYAAFIWPASCMARSQATTNLRFEDTGGAYAREIYSRVPQRSVIFSALNHRQVSRYFETLEPIIANCSIRVESPDLLKGAPLASIRSHLAEGRPVFLGGDCVDADKAPAYPLMASLVLRAGLPDGVPKAAKRAFPSELALYRVEGVREARPLETGRPTGPRGLSNDGTYASTLELLGVQTVADDPLPDGRQLLVLDLSWHVLAPLGSDWRGTFSLRNEQTQSLPVLTPERVFRLGGEHPGSQWKVGDRLVDRVSLFLPVLPRGRYFLGLGLTDADGRPIPYWPARRTPDQPGFDSILLVPIVVGEPPPQGKP